jgi:hypothetical protein
MQSSIAGPGEETEGGSTPTSALDGYRTPWPIALRHQQALHRWTPHTDEPSFPSSKEMLRSKHVLQHMF